MANEIKFGITERGDIAFSNGWIKRAEKCHAIILITKGKLTKEALKYMAEHKGKVILHATITGYGGTKLEPNVPEWEEQLEYIYDVVSKGYIDRDHVVIRVDPIIPTTKGLGLAYKVISVASAQYDFTRFRYSFLDVYGHIKERFTKADLPVPPSVKEVDPKLLQAFDGLLKIYESESPGCVFESCAEGNRHQTGCISAKDFELCGIDPSFATGKSTQRAACMCCGSKTELLDSPHRCGHQCLYCYWKD